MERLHHLHYMTHVTQTRLTNNNWRRRSGHAQNI